MPDLTSFAETALLPVMAAATGPVGIKPIRSLGVVLVLTGLGQVIVTAVVGRLIGSGPGPDQVAGLCVALALTSLSFPITVRLLSDRRAIEANFVTGTNRHLRRPYGAMT